LVVAAAGNGGTLGGSLLTRHPWVLPVAACDRRGRPFGASNLGASIGRRGLAAPGEAVTSLGTDGRPLTLAGTSFAAPFVTGAAALLLSLFQAASAADLKLALTRPGVRRRSVVPPLLDARAAHQFLTGTHSPRRNVHGNDRYRRTGC
ncbi:MAG TPA: S8 family serine peptidase, partial [Thermoanaerobaculia bacterium]|nr:S8 family serine peptidase [Thermoanaerobaculia bacterium]